MPQKTKPRSRKPILISILALSIVVATAWAISSRQASQSTSTLPDHLSAEALKSKVGQPGGLRSVLQNEELTDEQRRELRRNLRKVRRSFMQERIDDYFAANEEDKQSILDGQIDEFQKRRKEIESQREESDKNDDVVKNFQSMFRNQSKQERKANSESRNPDQTAQRMTYIAALRSRASERGVSIGRRGGQRGASSGRGRRP